MRLGLGLGLGPARGGSAAPVGVLASLQALATPSYVWAGGDAWQNTAGTTPAVAGDPVRNLPDARGSGPNLTGAASAMTLEQVGDFLCARSVAASAGLVGAFTLNVPATYVAVIDLRSAVYGASDFLIDGGNDLAVGFFSTGTVAPSRVLEESLFIGQTQILTPELHGQWGILVLEMRSNGSTIRLNGRQVAAKSLAISNPGGIRLGGYAGGRAADCRFAAVGCYAGSQIVSNLAGIQALEADLATAFGIRARSASDRVVTFFGDSTTEGYLVAAVSSPPHQFDLLKGAGWGARNCGIPGIAASGADSYIASLVNPQLPYSDEVVVNFGINDLLAGNSAATIYANIADLWSQLISAGWTVWAETIIDTTSVSGGSGTGAARDALNVLIRAGWSGAGLAGIIDMAADSRIGSTGAGNNATYFLVDKLHLTVAGNAVKAALYAAAIS